MSYNLHPFSHIYTFISVLIVHVEDDSFIFFREFFVFQNTFVDWIRGCFLNFFILNFWALLQENHVVIRMEIVILYSVFKESLTSGLNFDLRGNIRVVNEKTHSMWELYALNQAFEIIVFHE